VVDINKCIPPEGGLTPAQMRQLGIVSDGTEEQVRALANYFKGTLRTRTQSALQEIYINGLLSRPATFVANLSGTGASIFASIAERAYAGLINKVAKNSDVNGIHLKEAFDLSMGYMEGLKESFHLFGKIMRNKKVGVELAGKVDMVKTRDQAITKESFGANGLFGGLIDVFGTVVNIPGRLLLASDTVMKEMIKKGEIAALSRRESFKQFFDQFGRIPNSAEDNFRLTEMFENLKANPNAATRETAERFGKEVTFTADLGDQMVKNKVTGKIDVQPTFSKSMNNVLESDPTGILKIFIPFFKTPLQLLNFVGDRTPYINRFTSNAKFISEHGTQAQKELLSAKLAMGMSMYAMGIMAAMDGKLIGNLPKDPQMRKNYLAAGAQTDSYFDAETGRFIPLNRFDPIGAFLGVSAVLGNAAKAMMDVTASGAEDGFRKEHFEKYQQFLAEAAVGMTHVIMDRHYLSGVTQVIDTLMLDPHAVGKSIQTGATFISGGGFYGSLRRGLNKEQDARLRFTNRDFEIKFEGGDEPLDVAYKTWINMMNRLYEDIVAGIPGQDKTRPVKLDREGNETYVPGYANQALYTDGPQALTGLARIGQGAVNLFKPSRITYLRTDSVVDQKVLELNVSLDHADATEDIMGVKLLDEERDFFQKEYGRNNKEFLRPYLKSKSFNKLPTARQAEILKTELTRNRKDAKTATINQFPRIQDNAIEFENIKEDALERDQLGNRQGNIFKNAFGNLGTK